MRNLKLTILGSFLAFLAVIIMANNGWSQTINNKGTSGAPVAVSNSVVQVLPFLSGRKGWCIEPETVAIRCMVSGSTAAASPAPSTTVGFFFPFGVITCHGDIPVMANITNAQIVRLDCFSTGASTNVDTWEE